jgi:hypothetical protein
MAKYPAEIRLPYLHDKSEDGCRHTNSLGTIATWPAPHPVWND